MLLGCTKGIVFEFDRDGRYLNIWTQDDSLLVRPREELRGKTIDEVLGKDAARFSSAVGRVFETGVPETIEYELEVQNGRRWFIGDVVVPPDVPGRPRTVLYLVRDVTEKKALEEQLRQAQKMEAIGQLAGGIAHNFNNILTTITGYSELLLDGLGKSSTHRKHATRIRHASERASGLTSQLLAYARKRVLIPEVLDVNVVVASIGRMLQPLLEAPITLRVELEPNVGGTRVDRSGLEQVIMNLAINARDAMTDGGTITLRTETAVVDETFAAEAELAPGRYVTIVAEDTGAGMDAPTLARIFEPFFTTKMIGKGTGLGLSMAYGIVKQSGGHIAAQSTRGRGTVFRVFLPYVEITPRTAASGPVVPHEHKGGTVLVVEDNTEIRGLVHRYLRSAGYDVLVADDSPHALELARSRQIDLLLTDVVMPIMGGDVIAEQVRLLQPNVRVLYISGYPDDDANLIPRVASSRFLPKPFTRQVLVREVGAMFEP
ncbi:MAG TPA: ATP-binding protein [Kofleriaceae bacterium]